MTTLGDSHIHADYSRPPADRTGAPVRPAGPQPGDDILVINCGEMEARGRLLQVIPTAAGHTVLVIHDDTIGVTRCLVSTAKFHAAEQDPWPARGWQCSVD